MFGWLATACFIMSPIFLAWKIKRQGHCRFLPWEFINPWWLGELCAIVHTAISFELSDPATWPLYFNYLTNVVCLVIIVKYKVWERNAPTY